MQLCVRGMVASLARPGGNVTGLSLQSTDLSGKRLELLRAVVPGLRRLAILAKFLKRAILNRFVPTVGAVNQEGNVPEQRFLMRVGLTRGNSKKRDQT